MWAEKLHLEVELQSMLYRNCYLVTSGYSYFVSSIRTSGAAVVL